MGKSGNNSSKNYYGNAAGIVCQGQLDFLWGFMINNVLSWPPNVRIWDSQKWAVDKQVLYTDGHVYKASAATFVDPPAFPWVAFAAPWVAGAYLAGAQVVRNGHVWAAKVNTSVDAPPAHTKAQTGTGPGMVTAEEVADWRYVSTPAGWVSSGTWNAGSIVAWEGRVYTTPSDTTAEPPAAPWVLWKVDRASVSNPLKFTVPGGGDVFLYWGTGTQVLDTVDEAWLSAQGHPAYRHRAVVVLKNFLFGQDTVTPPSVQVLGGRIPQQSLIVGAAADMDGDWQVNPWCVIAEVLTHPVIGLGLPNAMFDAASWQAEADRCAVHPELYYISPMITSLTKVRALVGDLLGYPDAFIFWSTIATLVAGHWPHHEAPPAWTDANTIDRNDITEEFSESGDGWLGTSNAMSVGFRDIQAAFKSRPATAPNLFNRTVTRQLMTEQMDRPHIVRLAQAMAWATEYAKIAGDRKNDGDPIAVRAEKAATIGPGSIFLLRDDVTGTSTAMRCTQKLLSAPPDGTARLTYQTERGLAPQPYSPTPLNPPAGAGAAPSPVTNFQFVQLPFALGGGASRLACLAARQDTVTTALQVWYQQAGIGPQLLGTVKGFAVAGTCGWTVGAVSFNADLLAAVAQANSYQVTATGVARTWLFNVAVHFTPPGGGLTAAVDGTDYVMDTDAGQITILTGGAIVNGSNVQVAYNDTIQVLTQAGTPADDVEQISSALTTDEVDDGTLLLFLFRANDPKRIEIASVAGVETVGAGTYNLRVKRGMYGTLQGGGILSGGGSADWDVNDLAVIIPKASILPLAHASFAGLQEIGAQANFVLAPGSAWFQSEPSEVYDPASDPGGYATTADYTFSNVYAPSASWIQLLQNGAIIANFAAAFALTDVLDFSFELASTEGLAQAVLVGYLGEQETALWTQNFNGETSAAKTVEFSFPSNGLWRLALNVMDQGGNWSSTPLYMPGGAVEQQVLVGAPAPSPVLLGVLRLGPIIEAIFQAPAAGVTIQYQTQDRGTLPVGGAWAALPGTYIIYVPAGTVTLYAKGQQSGHADSAVLSWNL